MRIAYVINSVEGGGAAQPVPAITRVLRDAGAQVRVFALTPRDRRGLPAMVEAGLDPAVREGGLTDHLAAALWLRRQLLDWGATHIWTSLSRATILGLILGPMLGLPVVSWQHAAFLKPWNRRLMRLLESRAMLWVGDSQSVAALTAQRLAVPQDRLACWPIFAADPVMPQSRPWQPGEPVRIGTLGRLHPVKGYDVLIAALARMDSRAFTLSIAGDGAERDRLESLARQAGVEVRFTGYTDDPHAFLAGLHLYVQPSRSEGFCIAAHEALTAGLPVVASAVGELPFSIRQGETGLIVPPGDPEALASALDAMLADPARLQIMGGAARRDMLDRFSQDRFVANGTAILNYIRQARAGRPASTRAATGRSA
ncbi:glycosyltransferase [Sphingobium sp. LB126]|uniref:glycosyltransferase family 4 protein n=1 Tax=Sphingobium sp. LB126 TaxID=1983755 RepID=UPI000C1FFB4E|nr:glycosyltransferase family 4 protein [Sphingobium sp. LB126]PJG45958.1 glycosyltransferase [Sphingobium sp. LB126]